MIEDDRKKAVVTFFFWRFAAGLIGSKDFHLSCIAEIRENLILQWCSVLISRHRLSVRWSAPSGMNVLGV